MKLLQMSLFCLILSVPVLAGPKPHAKPSPVPTATPAAKAATAEARNPVPIYTCKKHGFIGQNVFAITFDGKVFPYCGQCFKDMLDKNVSQAKLAGVVQ